MSDTTTEQEPYYENWQDAGLHGHLLSYLWNTRPSLGQIIPGYSADEPWYQKALDIGSIPARMVVSPLRQAGEAFQAGMESPNLLQDPSTQHQLTSAMMNFGALATALPVRSPGSLGVFGGVTSKTADLHALARAEAMTNASIHPAQIWEATGWWKGPGGQWRHEIPDEAATINPNNPLYRTNQYYPGLIGVNFGAQTTLGEYLNHPDLYNAYPQLKNIPLEALGPGDIMANIMGAYDPVNKKMMVGGGAPSDVLDTLLHESQHVVQDIEGFPRGSSIREFLPADFHDTYNKAVEDYVPYRDKVNDIKSSPIMLYESLMAADKGTADSIQMAHVRKARSEMSQQEIEGFIHHYENVRDLRRMHDDAVDQYTRTAGEVESRLVEARRKYDPEERLAIFPPRTQGYPQGSLYIRGPTGSSFRATPVEHDPFAE